MQQIAVKSNRKLKKVILILVIGLLAFGLLIVTGISTYVGWALTHPERYPLSETPAAHGMKYNEVSFRTKDDVLLEGWFIPSKTNGYTSNGKTIVFVHSYAGNRLEEGFGILNLTEQLQKLGYNAFLFDLRASGESEGQMTSIGYFEKLDVNAAVQTVKELAPGNKIIVMGFSMGASTSILTAGENKDIAAVVADSPFADLKPFLSNNLSHWSGLPDFPFTPFIMSILPHLTGIKPSLVKPVEEIQKLSDQQSVFLIHGMDDRSIPYQNSVQLDQEVPHNNHDLWLVPHADHVTSNKVEPEEYIKKLIEFLNRI